MLTAAQLAALGGGGVVEGPRGAVGPVDVERAELERGMRFMHWMAAQAQEVDYDHELTLYGLAELLVAKGVIEVEELNYFRARVKERADRERAQQPQVQIGADVDKYSPAVKAAEIDCDARIGLCRAACCRLTFPLSKQDLDEGVARWEYQQPYMNKRRDDGWCVHNDVETHGCRIHAHRPVVCRVYDCRQDARIWVDFEARVPHPSLAALAAPQE
jgi:hypothetical protein